MQQPIHSDQSSHGQPTYKNKITPTYGLDLFVRAAFGDSHEWDYKHDDHVDL